MPRTNESGKYPDETGWSPPIEAERHQPEFCQIRKRSTRHRRAEQPKMSAQGKEPRRSTNYPGRDTEEVTSMPDNRNTADKLQLATGALVKAQRLIEVYDDDPDADAGELIEDLRALVRDHLLHLGADTAHA